jgi:hypothetical protein
MNMIFELIGLLLVVGCAFFTFFFFLAAVAGTMVVILGWGISIVTPKVVTCTNDCITTVFFDAKPFGWLLIVFSLTMMFFIIRVV